MKQPSLNSLVSEERGQKALELPPSFWPSPSVLFSVITFFFLLACTTSQTRVLVPPRMTQFWPRDNFRLCCLQLSHAYRCGISKVFLNIKMATRLSCEPAQVWAGASNCIAWGQFVARQIVLKRTYTWCTAFIAQ